MDPGRHDHAGVEIDGVLRLVGKVRGAVLHPGDARLGIGRRRPVGVRQGLVLAGAVEADQILGTRRLDAALAGQTPQHLLVILAGIPPHQAAQRGIGLLGRGIDADPLGAYQIVLVRDLEQKAEHGVVDLQRQPRPGHAERRVVGHRLAIRQAQKAMQRQGISAPPGDLALGIQTFELADEQHAEVAAWRDRRAANAVLVVPLAQHLDGFVELGLGQHLIAPVVKRVSGCQVHRQTAPTASCLQAVAQPSHCHAVTSRSAPHQRA